MTPELVEVHFSADTKVYDEEFETAAVAQISPNTIVRFARTPNPWQRLFYWFLLGWRIEKRSPER